MAGPVTDVRPAKKSGALAASQPMRGHLAMLRFSAVVAGSFSLGAMMANDIAPAPFNALRFFIAAAVIGGLGAATGSIDRTMARAPWRYVILGALFCVFFVLMYEGLKTATPVSIAAMFTLTPVISALFGWMLLRQITTARMASALVVGGVGAVWVIFALICRRSWRFALATARRCFSGALSRIRFTHHCRVF